MERCILPVCGGSAEMNGKVYLNFLRQNASNIKQAHIVLADTLDAHNMTTGPSDWELAIDCARALGDRWLRKHYEKVSTIFGDKVSLLRWDEIKGNESFPEKLSMTKRLYKENKNVSAYVHRVCWAYAELKAARQKLSGGVPDMDRLMNNSINYMIEEIAGSSVYWDLYGCDVLYPGEYFHDRNFFNRNGNITGLTVPENLVVNEAECLAA